MTYTTIDTLPDLTKAEMNAAIALTFSPLTPFGTSTNWDVEATYTSSVPQVVVPDVFVFTGVAHALYDMFSSSALDPSSIKVYDSFGNAIAMRPDSDYDFNGSDMLSKFAAPYSGTFYVSAGWNQLATSPRVSLNVYADLNPVADLPNVINGTRGDDSNLFTTSLNDHIDGGAGIDTVTFPGSRANYNIIKHAGTINVIAKFGIDDTDVLRNIEVLKFYDTSVELNYVDLTQALYVSYFGRAADVGGLKSFQSQLDVLKAPTSVGGFAARYATDPAIKSLIDSFGASGESQALYSGDNKAFVKAIYFNLLNRNPDQAGLDFWSGAIDSGALTRANASLSIMAGALSNTSDQGRTDAALVGVKIDVASNFTDALVMDKLGARYEGAGAAAVARDMLRSLSATTDVIDFQASLKQAIGRLPAIARSAPDEVDHLPPTAADAIPATLTGMDSNHDTAAWFA